MLGYFRVMLVFFYSDKNWCLSRPNFGVWHAPQCINCSTTPTTPHHSIFYSPDAVPGAQPTASKH